MFDCIWFIFIVRHNTTGTSHLKAENMGQRCCNFTFVIPIRVMQNADVFLLRHDVCKLGLLYSEIAVMFIGLGMLVYAVMLQHARKQIAVTR